MALIGLPVTEVKKMILDMSNGELEEIYSGLESITKENIVLPVSVSYRIVRNKIIIQQALSAFRITRDDIIARYSNGNGTIFEKDDPVLFGKATSEIGTISKERNKIDIQTITMSELAEDKLPLNVVSALGFMMKNEKEE